MFDKQQELYHIIHFIEITLKHTRKELDFEIKKITINSCHKHYDVVSVPGRMDSLKTYDYPWLLINLDVYKPPPILHQ